MKSNPRTALRGPGAGPADRRSGRNTRLPDNWLDEARDRAPLETMIAILGSGSGLGDDGTIDEDLTLLAPTDHAFARIPHEVKDRLLGNSRDRRRFLAKHLVPERLSANEIARRRFIPRLRGGHLPVATRDGAMRVGPAILTRGDLRTPGGIVHVIDDVLLTA